MNDNRASRESPSPRLRIESIPGLNLDDALDRVMGNRALYESLLLIYRDQYRSAPDRIEEWIGRGEWQTVEDLVHSIKGTSGMIGAVAVYQAAEPLDQHLKETIQTGIPPPGTLSLLDRFLAELRTLLMHLDRAAAEGSDSRGNP